MPRIICSRGSTALDGRDTDTHEKSLCGRRYHFKESRYTYPTLSFRFSVSHTSSSWAIGPTTKSLSFLRREKKVFFVPLQHVCAQQWEIKNFCVELFFWLYPVTDKSEGGMQVRFWFTVAEKEEEGNGAGNVTIISRSYREEILLTYITVGREKGERKRKKER